MRKLIYSMAVLMAAGTLSLQAQDETPVNLMEGAVTSHNAGDVPEAPWLSWNSSSKELDGGNGWDFRSQAGDKNGTAAQIFFRWNSNNNPDVYAYEIELTEDYKYLLTFDATTNDGKSNTLIIGFTNSLDNVTSTTELPDAKSFTLDGHDSGVLWSDPVKVEAEFAVPTTGKYYILFSGTAKGGNIIIRGANFSLVQNGTIDYEPLFTALQGQVEEYFNTLIEDGFEGGDYAELNAIYEWLYYEGDDYKTAYTSLQDAFVAFQAALPTYKEYDALRTAITQYLATGKLELASEETMSALSADMMMTPADVEAAKTKITTLTKAWRAAVESAAVAGGVEDAVAQTLSDWTTENIGENTNEAATLADGDQPSPYFDKYNTADCKATQTATLAKGVYRYALLNRGSVDLTDYTLAVSAADDAIAPAEEDGELSIELNHIGNQGSVFGRGWDISFIDFQVTADNTEVTFTVSANTSGNQWISFTNPTLVQISDKDSTAVAEIEAAEAEAAYYTIDGVKVTGKLAKGLYIKVAGEKASKVLVK